MSWLHPKLVLPAALLPALCLAACSPPPDCEATVRLSIDGQSHGYRTTKAQYDQQERGGPYSIYLRRDNQDDKKPYLCLRYYTGNPVAELWVRHSTPKRAAERPDADLDKLDCFVPGVLSDGRQTLGWKDDEGQDRERNETGEKTCRAAVSRQGDELHVTFDGVLGRYERPKQSKGDKPTKVRLEPVETITVKGDAVLKIPR